MAETRERFRAWRNAHRRLLGWCAMGAFALAALLLAVFRRQAIAADIEVLETYFSLMRRTLLRALAVGLLVSLCAALLGVCLVLKRFSMIGDGLSHVGFGALTIATACGYATAGGMPGFLSEGGKAALAGFLVNVVAKNKLAFALAVVILFAFLLLRLSDSSAIKGDSAIAMISTGALALGVVVASLTSGMNTDVYNYLFGSILALSDADVKLSVGLCACVLILFFAFYHKIFAVTFDENFAKATGTPARAYNLLLAVLSAVTIVVGMRMMGTMLISGLIIFPALTSMRVFKRFRQVMISSAIVSLVCFALGLALSCLRSFPTGACIVFVNLLAFALFWAVSAIRNKS